MIQHECAAVERERIMICLGPSLEFEINPSGKEIVRRPGITRRGLEILEPRFVDKVRSCFLKKR